MQITIRQNEYDRISNVINIIMSVRSASGVITRNAIIYELKNRDHPDPENYADEIEKMIKRRKFITKL
jgi:hypothetical protein